MYIYIKVFQFLYKKKDIVLSIFYLSVLQNRNGI